MILKVDFERQIKVCQLKGVVRAEGQISGQKEYPVQRHKEHGVKGTCYLGSLADPYTIY